MMHRIRKSRTKHSKWHLRASNVVDLDLLVQAIRLQHGDLFDDMGQSPSDILERLFAVGKISAQFY